ncbi:hypothetical protein FWH13_02145 [Candidatus Saccharibacteria bacterium]|nr:hypothetical protein [Candidatus Saccharibacteria bacterium]
MNDNKLTPVVEIITGTNKETGKQWSGFKLKIGLYEGLFFPKPIEAMYIKNGLGLKDDQK